jgi:hypothetical protein
MQGPCRLHQPGMALHTAPKAGERQLHKIMVDRGGFSTMRRGDGNAIQHNA